jgi:hypothetical protein
MTPVPTVILALLFFLALGIFIGGILLHLKYRTPEAMPIEDVEPEPIPIYDVTEEGVSMLG